MLINTILKQLHAPQKISMNPCLILFILSISIYLSWSVREPQACTESILATGTTGLSITRAGSLNRDATADAATAATVYSTAARKHESPRESPDALNDRNW